MPANLGSLHLLTHMGAVTNPFFNHHSHYHNHSKPPKKYSSTPSHSSYNYTSTSSLPKYDLYEDKRLAEDNEKRSQWILDLIDEIEHRWSTGNDPTLRAIQN
jgi:hypothetical protein